MFDEALTPEQLTVITALTEGANSTRAAALAGVHRNTIANWRRNSLFFREALADAQYDRALLFRDKAEERFDRALETLDAILADPKASPSVRLKAALFILDKALTPPAPRKQVPFDVAEIHLTKTPAVAQNTETVHKVHNHAQCPEPVEPPAAPQAEPVPAGENAPIVHKSAQNAQTQTVRTASKVPRNAPCPCGSRLKFKRCCLGKAKLSMAA